MTGDVPQARQCTMPSCKQEAAEPRRDGALCTDHRPSTQHPSAASERVDGRDVSTTEDRSAKYKADNGGQATAPAYMDVETSVYPADLKDTSRWLTWQPTDDRRKVPRAPWETGGDRYVSAQDPEMWTDYETAANWAEKLPGYGLAFTIPPREDMPEDPYVLVDYDDARDPETGAIHPTVREHIQRANSYADVSTSGTGIHIFCRGTLPDDVKAVNASLPTATGFPDADIEVYDAGRYSAMTGSHLAQTPTETREAQAFLDAIAAEFATVAEGTPDELVREPERSRAALADVETTDDIQDVFDAIQHVRPSDIWLRSSVTHERTDGSTSIDPTWASSTSGTRLAKVGDGWVYRKGMHGLDALQVVALEEGIITSEGEYPSGEVFWRAVEALRDRGAHIPEYEASDDAGHVPVLPNSPRVRATADGFDWTRDGRGDELTIEDARERTQTAIETALDRCDQTLVEALPTLGKSYGAIAAAAATETPVTVLTGRGNKEQYQQFREWADEHGLSHYTLPSFTRDCDTANSEHGQEWAETVRDWYRRGATPRDIHAYAELELGRPLPCQEHEGQECPYSSKWRFDPDEYDVLIGHYTHAHQGTATQGRSVLIDEFPGGAYETQLGGGTLARAVTTFLQERQDLPFDDYADLMNGRTNEQRRADALATLVDEELEPDSDQAFQEGGHAVAPLAVVTLLAGATNDLGNGWERAGLGDGRVGLFDREQGAVHLLTPPSLHYARGVVGLDGTPTQRLWELTLGVRLNHRPVLSEPERETYVRDALNLNIVRTTEWVKPYNSADHVNVDRDGALLEAIGEEHGERPAVITTATAEEEYDAAGITALTAGSKHYGNVLGSNEFANTRLGAVIGSQHYGDQFIEKWSAYGNGTVSRNETKGAGLSYGPIGNEVLRHMREHETLQAAMRFGRDGNGAVVYVHTDTLPEWVPVAGEGRVLKTWSDGTRQVLTALADLDAPRTTEVAAHEAVDIGTRQVQNVLSDLVDRNVLTREQASDDGRAFVWRDDGLHRLGDHGEAELETIDLADLTEAEVDELARMGTYYTWAFANHDASCSQPAGGLSVTASNKGVAAPDGDCEGDGATD